MYFSLVIILSISVCLLFFKYLILSSRSIPPFFFLVDYLSPLHVVVLLGCHHVLSSGGWYSAIPFCLLLVSVPQVVGM